MPTTWGAAPEVGARAEAARLARIVFDFVASVAVSTRAAFARSSTSETGTLRVTSPAETVAVSAVANTTDQTLPVASIDTLSLRWRSGCDRPRSENSSRSSACGAASGASEGIDAATLLHAVVPWRSVRRHLRLRQSQNWRDSLLCSLVQWRH